MSSSEFTLRRAKIIGGSANVDPSHDDQASQKAPDPVERLKRLREASAREPQAPAEPPQTDEAETTAPAADALERLKRLNELASAAREGRAPTASGDPAPLPIETDGSEAPALERLARLNGALREGPTTDTPPLTPQPAAPPAPMRQARKFRPSGRIIKSLLALAVVIALAWVPVQRLLTTTSAQATVNARLINLRAPIDGRVTFLARLAVGTLVKPGEPLLRVTNVRAERQRLDDLRSMESDLTSEISTQRKRLTQLHDIRADAKLQRDAFQSGRVRQLEARQAELEAELKAAQAHHEDAIKSFERSKDLKARGYQTTATLLHAERDFKVSANQVDAANKRLDANKVELEAARKGLFVGDSYNDLPRSAQRLDELNQQIADLTSKLEERSTRLEHVTKELASERAQFSKRSVVEVDATVRGRVWEALTADGEEVRSGQDLLRVLDCGGAVVTATVSEAVYNRLWIGQPVQFQMRGDSRRYDGSVAALTGLAAAGSNFAIEQTALTREPYHVTIAVPGLAARDECNVGRTGQVTFDTAPKETAKGLGTAARKAVERLKPTLP